MTSEWKYSSDGRGTATFLHGWQYLHLEGTAYECGMQHGELLASYIGETIERMKRLVYVKTGITWKYLKEIIYQNWKDRIRDEIKQELQGIVDGTNKTVKEKIDYADLILWNGYNEVMDYWLPMKKESIYRDVTNGRGYSRSLDHKEAFGSAFISTGTYTKDNSIVAAHNSMEDFAFARYENVIIDISPSSGNAFKMQAQPGCVHSIAGFYVTKAPMVITGTAINGFCAYDSSGIPLFVRIRNAVQYADSMDEFTEMANRRNTGGMASIWLLGDYRTNQIMRWEQGLNFSSKKCKEDGVYVSANIPFQPSIRNLECEERGFTDIRRSQGARQVRIQELLDSFHGSIDEKIAKQIISDHYDMYLKKIKPSSRTICAHYEKDTGEGMFQSESEFPYAPMGVVDAKVCTRQFAYSRGFVARYGSACGKSFYAKEYFKDHPQFAYLRDFIVDRPSKPWTYFG